MSQEGHEGQPSEKKTKGAVHLGYDTRTAEEKGRTPCRYYNKGKCS